MTSSVKNQRLRVLSLEAAVLATSSPYFLYSIPRRDQYDITMCTYFQSDNFTHDPKIRVIEGDNTLLGFYSRLRKTLREDRYDIVHIHTPHLGVMFLLAVLLGWTPRRHTVYTVHNSFQNFKLRNRLLMIPCFAFLARIVCCGKASYESMPPFYRWLAGRRMETIANGVNLELLDATIAEVPPAEKSAFTIVWIGRLVPIKNTTTMLQAFARVATPTDRLVIMGQGALKASLKAEAEALGIRASVEFTGLIPRQEVFRRLVGADLYVSTSIGEGLPVAVLEAMACRCPVVLSDIAPHREIAENMDFIPLVAAEAVDDFAEQIRKFRQMSAAERSAVGEQCRKLVEQEFSLEKMLRAYDDLFEQLTSVNT